MRDDEGEAPLPLHVAVCALETGIEVSADVDGVHINEWHLSTNQAQYLVNALIEALFEVKGQTVLRDLEQTVALTKLEAVASAISGMYGDAWTRLPTESKEQYRRQARSAILMFISP